MKPQQQAQLQSLGIDLYQALSAIDLASVKWLPDVCALLSISTQDCIFDAAQPYFDNNTKLLHLPKAFYSSEAALKKSIWHSIQAYIDAPSPLNA